MKIIFLDFDGVLNDAKFPATAQAYWDNPLQEVYVRRLERVRASADAKIVLCTSWRTHSSIEECQGWLDARGSYGTVIDKTPDLAMQTGPYITGRPPRWQEIQVWLSARSNVEQFVILDDEPSMGPLAANHVCPVDGMTDEDAALAIEVLGGAK